MIQRSLTDVRIRPAARADCDALLALYCEVHDMHVAQHPDEFEALTPEGEASLLREFASSDGSCLHVAEAKKGLVGCVRFSIRVRRQHGSSGSRRYVYIDMLVVAPKWQNKGIGRALLEQTHAFARANGVREIELHVYEFNAAGLHLYEQAGYRTLSRRMKINLS